MVTQQQLAELKEQGYTDEDIQQAVYEQQLNNSMDDVNERADVGGIQSNTVVGGLTPNNIIEWQLELDSILERIEHLLRGDRPISRNGSITYETPKTEDEQILNNYGVSEVMRLLSLYINRNTILSNYDEDTIHYKVYDFGCELADLFFLKYDEFGWKSESKRKLYPMLIREIIDVVHSSYLRALNGGERESIRKAISVQQNLAGGDNDDVQQYPRKQKKWFNPLSWGG